jgi:hypothetical protein
MQLGEIDHVHGMGSAKMNGKRRLAINDGRK